MKRLRKMAILCGWLALAAGCSGTSQVTRENLDPVTAVTVTRAARPLIFYRDNSARAAYARDFVYLGPIQVNRMGANRYYLWLGIWSALPNVLQADQRSGFETVTVLANGEPLQISLAGWSVIALGVTEAVYAKPVASAADAFYEVTADQIRLIAAADDLTLYPGGPGTGPFATWDGQQSAFRALNEFVGRTSE